MARPRNICQDAVLDAAEAVVLRAGAARLTLDAVAAQAGISKPTVVYDFRSKHALLKAIIDRRVAREAALLRAAAEAAGEASDASVRAQVAVAAERLPDDVQAVLPPVARHRLRSAQGGGHASAEDIATLLRSVAIP